MAKKSATKKPTVTQAAADRGAGTADELVARRAEHAAAADALELMPGVAGGLGAIDSPPPLDDAPPAGPDGQPLDRCKCGETAGQYRTIRETDRISGRTPGTGKPYKGIVWGVVVCSACGRRRPRKQFVAVVEETDTPGAR